MQNQIIRFLPEIIVAVFGVISAGSLSVAMAVHAHIEEKYPGFNEAMRPWCRYFHKGLRYYLRKIHKVLPPTKWLHAATEENLEDPKSRS